MGMINIFRFFRKKKDKAPEKVFKTSTSMPLSPSYQKRTRYDDDNNTSDVISDIMAIESMLDSSSDSDSSSSSDSDSSFSGFGGGSSGGGGADGDW